MDSSGSESSLTIDEDSSSSGKESDLDPEHLVDAKSSKFNPVIALCCEDNALNLPGGSKYLHVFELEKAIPDPTKEPIKKSSIEITRENAKKAKLNKSQKQLPGLKPLALSGVTVPTNSQSTELKSGRIQTPAAASFANTTSSKPGPSLPLTSSVGQQAMGGTPSTSTSASASASTSEPFYPMPGRKFLLHQMPVYRPPKKHPNVLTVMEDISGPLAVLREAKNSNRRVKIWTRGLAGIRGYCIASVQGFDSHWNLALLNVHEVFQRKRAHISSAKTKSPNLPDPTTTQEDYSNERQEYQSGKYLRDLSKARTQVKITDSADRNPFLNINSRTQTTTCKDMFLRETKPILIEGPDALLTCRVHFSNLKLGESQGRQTGSSVSQSFIETRHLTNLDLNTNTALVNQKSELEKSASVTKSELRKKRLTIFQEPERDPFGFLVVARSKHYEIVERFQKHLFLVGNDVSFIELYPNPAKC